jgi:succinyl-CoA synthetase beta subunit
MKIHEYQAKEVLKKYNVPIQDGIAVKDISEIDNAITGLQQRGINQFIILKM